MNQITNDLPEAIRRQAERILREIDNAGSMIVAVKSGARANGFVLGIMCSGDFLQSGAKCYLPTLIK